MDTTPYWQNGNPLPHFPKLRRNITVDVAVVGAGITGITAAYLLKKMGLSVVLVERERCVQRDTLHTSAHLTYVTDQRLLKLANDFGRGHAQAVWDAGTTAIGLIERNIQDLRLACDFASVPGFLHTPLKSNNNSDDTTELKKEAKLAAALGFEASFIKRVPFVNRPGIRFSNQAKFHPRKYLAGLLRAFASKGGHVFENTSVQEVKGDPLTIVTSQGNIQCGFVVIATHVPLQGKTNLADATLFQTRLAPYTSYVVGGRAAVGSLPVACFWDTSDPYYYLRVDRNTDHDYVIFGGKDHKTGQSRDTVKRFRSLEETLRALVPNIVIDRHWSGQVIDTNDHLPLIGETASQQFVATGFAGNGMTFGTIAALMACDQFAQKKNPWQELFSPDRKMLKGGVWNYLKENKDYPYYLLKDQLAKAEGTSVRSVPPGHGKILKLRGQKITAYRDKKGRVTLRSAICPHLGCVVGWNKAESTWDCPCHGSRFAATGQVVAGPAESDLRK
jgi:glycine/D-amino acid oxidase-like deaminating enzyme/nitrite reductase/ring-hydroxylating ferredoxin subunit